MKNTSKYKIDISIFLCIVLFAVISVVSIGSAQVLLQENNNLVFKQILWYLIGFGLIYLIMCVGNNFLYKNAWTLYIIGIILLVLVLFLSSIFNSSINFKPGS